MYIMKWWNEQWNDETLEGLSNSVNHPKWTNALAYDEINNEMIKWTKKWWNEQWKYETLKGLCKKVKHPKWPSALAYDEMYIHVKRWVIMKSKCVKVNVWGDNMKRLMWKMRSNSNERK